MADDNVDDVVLTSASFTCIYDSSEDDVGDSESRKKSACRPRHFWIHDVIRGREVSKASVSVVIASSYHVVASTVVRIIPETWDATWSALHPLYMPSRAKQDWLLIASEFETNLEFSKCVGAVDGKHVGIKSPANSGFIFFNYKGIFSIVLLAVVDANYSLVVIETVGWRNSCIVRFWNAPS
jgi:hypothetical protein